MAGQFGDYDEEEDNVLVPKEPQVTSEDPAERKAARSLRIKRRQEALKRAEQPLEESAGVEEPGAIEQATALAAEELQRLSLDGAAKVTNVKVTTDEREVIRRTEYFDRLTASMAKLEEEAKSAQLQYEAICASWDSVFCLKDPLDIEAGMKEQKRKCDELLAQKDRMIQELKDDLHGMDIAYYEDLEKQDNDIKELSERIEKQVSIMKRGYEKQLSLIEYAINFEREAMVDHNNKRWEALYKQRDKEELAHMDYKEEKLEEHKEELEAIMWDHHSKYRLAKIELESLIQELQKELEKLKCTCIINTEKIGYNYQILKKREEENVFVRSQQKRKLNKMSDVVNALRAKIRKAADDGAAEEIKADAEIKKLMQMMDDLEKKAYHFAHVNNYKFSQVWKMSSAKCHDLARELRQTEVALHAHILSEPAPPPPPPPPKSPLSVYEAQEAVKTAPPAPLVPEETANPTSEEAKEAKDRLIHHILQLVADNTGFLVEDRLFKLLEKFNLDSRNLCQLDAIFMAMEIQADEDVDLLCKTFMKYAFCPICVGLDMGSDIAEMTYSSNADDIHEGRTSSVAKTKERTERMSMVRGRASIARSLSASTSRSIHVGFRPQDLTEADQALIAEADEIVQKCGNPQTEGLLAPPSEASGGVTSTARRSGARGVTVTAQPTAVVVAPKPNPFLCPVGHRLEIEPMQVLTALGDFVSVFVPPEKKKYYAIMKNLKPPDFTTASRRLTNEEIDQYWTQWKHTYSPEKERFWDGLLTGLNNYLPILQERDRLHEEVEVLRERNTMLRRLIHGALPELPAPPPAYAKPYPPNFTCTVMDEAPDGFFRLPPIKYTK